MDTVVRRTFARAAELDLAGSVHDALMAAVCAEYGVALVTLDSRQHQIALASGHGASIPWAEVSQRAGGQLSFLATDGGRCPVDLV